MKKAAQSKPLKLPKTVKGGLSGFLVCLRHACDDFPVGLFATRQDAALFAKRIHATDGMPDDLIRQAFSLDASTPLGVSIVEFCDGVLSRQVDYQEFGEPWAD